MIIYRAHSSPNLDQLRSKYSIFWDPSHKLFGSGRGLHKWMPDAQALWWWFCFVLEGAYTSRCLMPKQCVVKVHLFTFVPNFLWSPSIVVGVRWYRRYSNFGVMDSLFITGEEASDFTFISIFPSLLEPCTNMCGFLAAAINLFLHSSICLLLRLDFLLSLWFAINVGK